MINNCNGIRLPFLIKKLLNNITAERTNPPSQSPIIILSIPNQRKNPAIVPVAITHKGQKANALNGKNNITNPEKTISKVKIK